MTTVEDFNPAAVKEYWEKATPMSFSPEKWTYEQKRQFRYALQDYMHNVFRFKDFKGQEVLEVGCGSGIDAVEFARHGAVVTATDITDNSIQLTRNLIIESGIIKPIVKVTQILGDTLPFPDNTFDCVYSYGVLHHIKDVDKVMAEIQRVLKPGGKVMAMLYNRDSLLYAYSLIYWHGVKDDLDNRDRFDKRLRNIPDYADILTSQYSERIEGCPYTKAYSKKEAWALFNQYFKDIEISVHYNVIDTPQQRKVKLDIPDELELGWHLVIKGVK